MCFVATVSRLNDYPKLAIADYKRYLRTSCRVNLKYFDSVLDKALNDCIDLMKKVRPEKPKRTARPKTSKRRVKS